MGGNVREIHKVHLWLEFGVQEDEEPLEDDELPEHLRPMPNIDMSKLNANNPEELLQATKKGRTLMTFVTVGGKPTRDETEEITKLWQSSLWNNHIQAERCVYFEIIFALVFHTIPCSNIKVIFAFSSWQNLPHCASSLIISYLSPQFKEKKVPN